MTLSDQKEKIEKEEAIAARSVLKQLQAAEQEVAALALSILAQYRDGAITFQECMNSLASKCGLVRCDW